jgi:hypothetical protein
MLDVGILEFEFEVAIFSSFNVLTGRAGAGAIFAGEATDDGVEDIMQAGG